MTKLTNFIIIWLMIIFLGTAIVNLASAIYIPTEDDLIKTDNNTAVYIIGTDGKRHLFVNEPTFWTWYNGSWADQNIITISQSDFDNLPSGTNITARAGVNLIKFQNSPRVYAVTPNAIIRQVVSSNGDDSVAKVLYSLFDNDDYVKRIITIQNGFENDYQKGEALTLGSLLPNGSLTKYQGNEDIFYIENEQKRKITTNGFKINNFKSNSIIEVNNPGLINYTDGALINSREQFSKPQITNPSAPIPLCKVYTYQDRWNYNVGKHCLNKITIKGIYFVAKNQTAGIKTYWQDSMLDIFTQIKNFYESQFNNKIQITIDTPAIIYGNKNIEEYNAYSITQETREKIGTLSDRVFTVLMIYPIQAVNDKRIQGDMGGGSEVGNSSSATNNWGWLDPEALGTITTKIGTNYYGYLGSAHEFSHAIGIPHPWEEIINRDSTGKLIDPSYGNDEMGSIMSYGGQKGPLIPNSFIRLSVKNKMIVK